MNTHSEYPNRVNLRSPEGCRSKHPNAGPTQARSNLSSSHPEQVQIRLQSPKEYIDQVYPPVPQSSPFHTRRWGHTKREDIPRSGMERNTEHAYCSRWPADLSSARRQPRKRAHHHRRIAKTPTPKGCGREVAGTHYHLGGNRHPTHC